MLSRGVRSLKLETFDMMRVWASITGLLLAVWFFAQFYMGGKPSEQLPMLVAAIGGFELFLYVQDMMRRRARNG